MTAQVLAAVIGSAVVAALSLAGVIYTARLSRRANLESATAAKAATVEASRIRDREVLVTQQAEQLDRLWPRLDQMDRTLEVQRAEAERDRVRIHQLERENRDLHSAADQLNDQVARLSNRLDDYTSRYRVAILYVAQLRSFMAEHLPTDIDPPVPPESLAFDLANPMETTTDPPPNGWPPPRR